MNTRLEARSDLGTFTFSANPAPGDYFESFGLNWEPNDPGQDGAVFTTEKDLDRIYYFESSQDFRVNSIIADVPNLPGLRAATSSKGRNNIILIAYEPFDPSFGPSFFDEAIWSRNYYIPDFGKEIILNDYIESEEIRAGMTDPNKPIYFGTTGFTTLFDPRNIDSVYQGIEVYGRVQLNIGQLGEVFRKEDI